ncbi:MAG TPA: metal ABC transporter ATP-binding protein [Spirochaetota bacterium]|nr:metal ABC transporter ATP-binding protein [Spirochaetota bacterium]
MIEIKDLTYTIKKKVILENINLTIVRGEFASIIGPNGGGKTTLLKIILGQIKNYTGKVLIDGTVNDKWLKKNIIGYLPQQERIDDNFPATGLDIVLMGLAGQKGLLSFFNNKDKTRALNAMESTGSQHLYKEKITNLSGGELQRVLLARALVSGSDYLFLDEPEAGVDLKSTEKIYKILKREQEKGKTIIDISHNISSISKYSTSMICLNHTLHCHKKPELVNADIIRRTFGDVMQIVERIKNE